MEQCGFGSKHGFELKFFFSVFSKLNQTKINKAGVKLQAMWHWKYSVTLESNANLMKRIWKCQNMKIACFHILYIHCKTSCIEAERQKCYFNVFSPSIHWDNYCWKKKFFFSKLHDKCCESWRNPWRIVNIPFCDVITKIGTCLFVTSC